MLIFFQVRVADMCHCLGGRPCVWNDNTGMTVAGCSEFGVKHYLCHLYKSWIEEVLILKYEHTSQSYGESFVRNICTSYKMLFMKMRPFDINSPILCNADSSMFLRPLLKLQRHVGYITPKFRKIRISQMMCVYMWYLSYHVCTSFILLLRWYFQKMHHKNLEQKVNSSL